MESGSKRGKHRMGLPKSQSMIEFPMFALRSPTEKDNKLQDFNKSHYRKNPQVSGSQRFSASKDRLLRSKSMVNFGNIETITEKKTEKPVTKFDIPLPRSSSMADFTPAASDDLVNQLYTELRKIRPPSVSREESKGNSGLQVYRRRWYILTIYSLLAGTQAYVWNFWGPIAATSEHAYGWTDADIAFYANWGPICYIPMVIPFSWLISTKGLRVPLLVACGLVAAGSAIRCTITEPPYNKWVVHSGQLLNGIAGPIGKGMGPVVSATWFPPNQRTTATAIMSGFQWFAVGISCIAGPLSVPETFKSLTNITSNNSVDYNSSELLDAVIETERRNINYYLYGMAGFCLAIFIAVIVYFPSKPPLPPSPSASIHRLDYKSGIIRLIRHKPSFWCIAVLYGSSTGMREAWGSMLNVNLKAHGISQNDAGWIGFYSSVAGWIVGIVIARFADLLKRRLKIFLIVLYFLSTILYIWLTFSLVGILPTSKPSLYVSIIASTMILCSTSPLFYEAACEIAYPISEGIANLVLTMQANIASLIFLGILSIPNIGTVWMNWLLIGIFGLCFLCLLLMKEDYSRSDTDDKNKEMSITTVS